MRRFSDNQEWDIDVLLNYELLLCAYRDWIDVYRISYIQDNRIDRS